MHVVRARDRVMPAGLVPSRDWAVGPRQVAGVRSCTEWAENRKEYVPEGEFMHTYAICVPITTGLGGGYVLNKKMAGCP